MKQKRRKPEEIIRLLRECDGSGLSQEQLCQQKQISIATLHRWRKKYGQMDEADAKRLKALEREKESTELKKMYAEAMRGIKILQETIEKSCERGAPPSLPGVQTAPLDLSKQQRSSGSVF